MSHASAQQGEVKVIILLYSSEKKAYVGFIPIDQFSFVNKIKSVIQSARKGQVREWELLYYVDLCNLTWNILENKT